MKLFATTLMVVLGLTCTAHAAGWRRPVDGPVLRPFLLTADRFARGQHRGVDLAAPLRSVVRAACTGKVRFAGFVPGGGRTVSVACGRFVAAYQHLDAISVRRGQRVEAGARLATVGRSGQPRSSLPHVHLGVREAAGGRYVDPMALLGGGGSRVGPPVLVGPRGSPPLGRAPAPGPPAAPAPVARAPGPVARPAPGRAARVPLAVWAGLAAFGLGMPLGGLVHHRRRRRRDAQGVELGAQVA